MGGKGSGGRRRGAGRPRKSAAEHLVTGDAGRRGRVLEHPSAVAAVSAGSTPVVDESDAPDVLSVDERNVWMKLAPLAMQSGTLTKASELAFALLCQNIVAEQKYRGGPMQGTADHRGMIRLVEAGMESFNLRPMGKPLASATPDKPVSKLDRFMKRA